MGWNSQGWRMDFLSRVASWFRPKPCVSCAAKTEHIGYLQKLIDQLLIKNGMRGLEERQPAQETAAEKRAREADEKFDAEMAELVDVKFYGE